MADPASEATRLTTDPVAALRGRVGSVLRGDRHGRGLRLGVCCAAFNGGVTLRLLEGALKGFEAGAVDAGDVSVAWVPGAFELPLCARAFVASRSVDAVVALGAVIRGETDHYDFVAGECARGLQQVQLRSGVPVVFGVLTTDTTEQALARAAEGHEGTDAAQVGWESNKGYEAAVTAIEMARLLRAPSLASRRDGG